MITNLVLAALFVGASQQPGSISGVITDTASRGLPGATLVTTSGDGVVRRTTTDLKGRFHFAVLAPGRYRTEVSMPGFEARARDLTVVSAREEIWSGTLLFGAPLGAGSIERRVMNITGWNARDCGRYDSAASETALSRSLECALASARAGQPFAAIVQSPGEASHAGFGLLEGADGIVQVFRYEKSGLVFHSEPCSPSQLTLRQRQSGRPYTFACHP
jgi:hypothetical protein